MHVTDIKAFVPSKNFSISREFYSEIGFIESPISDDLTLFHNGDCWFFLQRFFNKELAANFMLQICVEDIDTAFERCTKSQHKTKISPISDETWGRVFYIWGPAGELLHFTQLKH